MSSCFTDLRQCGVELEDLALALHLAHTQFTGQLHCRSTETLQSEGALQVPLRSAPYLLKRQLLQRMSESFWVGFHYVFYITLLCINEMKTPERQLQPELMGFSLHIRTSWKKFSIDQADLVGG